MNIIVKPIFCPNEFVQFYLLESKSVILGNRKKRKRITVVYLRDFGDSFLFCD